ncbi:hypothetical protein DPMN_006953 [Dreissena polymorpha]|uniref:Uncharacterized protein n=1 Tax=Dreissena polymorpha TaxID=45954 RepID=A0A9D4RXV5_DREPO|nr:hypothetical protein DPMN_006953 [Dreissena polymorpha]
MEDKSKLQGSCLTGLAITGPSVKARPVPWTGKTKAGLLEGANTSLLKHDVAG